MLAATVKSLDDLPAPYRELAAVDSPRNTDMLFLLLAALVFSD